LVKSAFEEVYPCLGITCAQVGALVSSSGALLDPATAACTLAPIAGYIPGSDVVQHNRIDLDQAAMETALSALDFATATHWYAVGGNSLKSSGNRTMRAFSTSAQSRMYSGCPGCPYAHYSRFYDYYGDFAYADTWVSAALAGTNMSFSSGRHGPNDFGVLGTAARKEAVKKGTAYMNVWMYAIREFEDAIDDCTSCTSNCNTFSINSGSVHAWDEGVAFYTGSLEGELAGGSSGGKLVYRLAEKRCANFGTCGLFGNATSGTSKVNLDLFPLFAEGARLLERGECSLVRPVVDQIVSLMTVPLVQGSLRYAYKIGMVASDRSQKNAAEGAVFTAAVLPLVHYCNPAAAQTISAN
jgi:Notch-like protein